MGINMTIFEIMCEFTEKGLHTTHNQVGDIVHDMDIVNSVMEKCRYNWHLEGEGNFIGELTGAEFFEVVNIPDITHQMDEEMMYRVEVSY